MIFLKVKSGWTYHCISLPLPFPWVCESCLISLVLTLLVFAYLCLAYFACLCLHLLTFAYLCYLTGPCYWALLLGLAWACWAFLCLPVPSCALLGLAGSYCALLGLTGPYWALLGLTGRFIAFGAELTNYLTSVHYEKQQKKHLGDGYNNYKVFVMFSELLKNLKNQCSLSNATIFNFEFKA